MSPSNVLVHRFLWPRRGNLIRGDSTFYFRSFMAKRLYTPRIIKHARLTCLLRPLTSSSRDRFTLKIFSSLSGNPIGRNFPVVDFGKFRARLVYNIYKSIYTVGDQNRFFSCVYIAYAKAFVRRLRWRPPLWCRTTPSSGPVGARTRHRVIRILSSKQ